MVRTHRRVGGRVPNPKPFQTLEWHRRRLELVRKAFCTLFFSRNPGLRDVSVEYSDGMETGSELRRQGMAPWIGRCDKISELE